MPIKKLPGLSGDFLPLTLADLRRGLTDEQRQALKARVCAPALARLIIELTALESPASLENTPQTCVAADGGCSLGDADPPRFTQPPSTSMQVDEKAG
jgi:hypothetical protein